MKIKQIDAVAAYIALKDLNSHKFKDARIAMKVFDLYNKLKDSYDFRLQEEKKIYEAHPNYDPSIAGIRVLEDGSNREAANKEIKEIEEEFRGISNIETEIDFEPFEIDLEKETISLSGEDYGNLKAFIKFI